MKRQEAIERLQASLTEAIDHWLNNGHGDKGFDDVAWEPLGYIGDELARLMAKAAMAVIESSADVQDYLRENGITEDAD